jgi:hypothetical protein
MDGNIARQGEDKCSQISVFKPEGKGHSEELCVDARIILKWEGLSWIHLTKDRDRWLALVITIINLGSIKGGDIFDDLNDYKVLKKDFTPCNY